MDADDNPVFGISQPSNGGNCKLKCKAMGRRRKIPKEPDTVRRNIQRRLIAMFPLASGVTQQYEKLAKLSGVGAETMRKFMNGDSSMTLRKLTDIANAVGLTMAELFTDKPPDMPLPRKADPAADDRDNDGLHSG